MRSPGRNNSWGILVGNGVRVRCLHFPLWIYLILIFASSLLIEGANVPKTGILTMILDYDNPRDRDVKGDFCDTILKACEPILNICLFSEQHSKTCNIYEATTPNRGSRKTLSHTFRIELEERRLPEMNLNVTAMDHDSSSNHDQIAFFTKSAIFLSDKQKLVESMFRSRPNNKLPGHATINLTATLECSKNYYGVFCEKFCEPSINHYTCNPDGTRQCKPGFKGASCLEPDPCAIQKCAEHAQCVEDKQYPDKRKCLCGEGLQEKKECYPNYDACLDSPCFNGAPCRTTGKFNETPICDCPEMYTGLRCWKKRSPCREMAENITRELRGLSPEIPLANGDLEPVCLGNGECLEKGDEFKWFCKCSDGYLGQRCEVKERTFNFLTMGLVIGLILLVTLVLVLFFFLLRHRKKVKESRMMFGYPNFIYGPGIHTSNTYYPGLTVDSNQSSVYEDIVETTSKIYSSDPNSVGLMSLSKPNRNLPAVPITKNPYD